MAIAIPSDLDQFPNGLSFEGDQGNARGPAASAVSWRAIAFGYVILVLA